MPEDLNAYFPLQGQPLLSTALPLWGVGSPTKQYVLGQIDMKAIRSFISISDTRIQPYEIFFYCPNSGGAKDIQNDDFPYDSNKQVSAQAAATETGPAGSAITYPATSANRRKYENLNKDGSSTTVFLSGRYIMWLNSGVSPAQFMLVNATLK